MSHQTLGWGVLPCDVVVGMPGIERQWWLVLKVLIRQKKMNEKKYSTYTPFLLISHCCQCCGVTGVAVGV
jgi:hypothetical protein